MHFIWLLLILALSEVELISAQNNPDGRWGNVFDMNVIPIHAMMLGDGRVLAYGTDNKGKQGGDKYYEIWDTREGKHQISSNHELHVHDTRVNIFCSTLAMDVTTGNILIIGGDDGDHNGINDVLEFNSKTHKIRRHPKGNMKYSRWYGSSVNLPDGRIFVVGGESGTRKVQSPIPEIWSPNRGFKVLRGAEVPSIGTSLRAFRSKAWFYPHTYVNSSGDIIAIMGKGNNTAVYRIGVNGNGSIYRIGTKPFDSHMLGPSIMYDVDKVVFLDNDGVLWTADISNSDNPTFKRRRGTGKTRTNGAMALLPDGRVVISGGCTSLKGNGTFLQTAVYRIQIWDPVENKVFNGPKQDKPRLYHSTSLTLPDGTVFSAGGGAPGPVRNRNGQIYVPGYLVNPETGGPATRPVIEWCPQNVKAGDDIWIRVDKSAKVKRVTATKTGSMTHARNNDARWVELSFTKEDNEYRVTLPNKNIMIPGVWNLNVINDKGVPSVACIFGVNMADLPN